MRGFASRAVDPLVGEIMAVRAFEISDEGELFAVSDTALAWTPGDNVASCRGGEAHRAPDVDCQCGFYAFLDPRWLTSVGSVIAIVACWGDTIVGTRGVRAEYSRVVAVYLPDDVPETVGDALKSTYRVEVYRRVPDMLQQHPLSSLPGVRTRRGLSSPLTPTTLWVLRTVTAVGLMALPVISWLDPSLGLVDLRPWMWLAAAVLAGCAGWVHTGPRMGWRKLLAVGLGSWLGLLVLPLLLGPPTGLRVAVWSIAALLLTRSRIRRWRRREPPTKVIPNLALRERLATCHRSDWVSQELPRRRGRQVLITSAGRNWTIMYRRWMVPSSALGRITLLPVLPLEFSRGLAGTARSSSLLYFWQTNPSTTRIAVWPATRLKLNGRSFDCSMRPEDATRILGLPLNEIIAADPEGRHALTS